MDEILQELVPIMKKEHPRRPPTNENLYQYYMDRVKTNLHVTLCFSPVKKTQCNLSLSLLHNQVEKPVCKIRKIVLIFLFSENKWEKQNPPMYAMLFML